MAHNYLLNEDLQRWFNPVTQSVKLNAFQRACIARVNPAQGTVRQWRAAQHALQWALELPIHIPHKSIAIWRLNTTMRR
jgi:hypothetical protein